MSIVTEKTSKEASSDASANYPPGGVPRTPLEFRLGPHPKKDYLIWKTPPSRQLSQQKRQEFELDVTERFYDDYLGARNTGDSCNEVLTGVHKLGFNPDLYRTNALQGMAYDPSGPLPKTVDFQQMIRTETVRDRERLRTQVRQRRLSDSMLLQQPHIEYGQYGPKVTHLEPLTLPQLPQGPQYSHRPQSAMQKTIEEGLNPEYVPEVEKWLASASKKDHDAATKFLRTISSQGQRPDPATKASTHSTRVRSAVMTPSKQQRHEREMAETYKLLERSSMGLPHPMLYAGPGPKKLGPSAGGGGRKLRRSHSDVSTRGSMFTTTRYRPAHFTIHPEWASEAQNKH